MNSFANKDNINLIDNEFIDLNDLDSIEITGKPTKPEEKQTKNNVKYKKIFLPKKIQEKFIFSPENDSKNISNRSTIISDIEGQIDLSTEKQSISSTIHEPIIDTFVLNIIIKNPYRKEIFI